MILWLLLAAITVASLGALLRPLFRAPKAPAPRGAYDIEVYRDQLAELGRERERGLIGAAEYQAAEREIARRLLAAAGPEEARDTSARGAKAKAKAKATTEATAEALPGRQARRWIAFAIATLLPVAALALYLDLGEPEAPDFPFASRGSANAQAPAMPDLETAIGKLEARLAEAPDDQRGWLLLARSYTATGRYAKAADAYQRLLKLTGDRPEIDSDYAETLVMQAGGLVTEQARTLFQRVHAALPADPRARFYLGLARAQGGDGKGALEDWLALEADAPADAPWLPALRSEIKRVAKKFKLDPAKLKAALPPSAAQPAPGALSSAPAKPGPIAPGAPAPDAAAAANPPGPGAGDIAAAEAMAPEARDQMVRAMVERLAARLKTQPDDVDGWRRLGRAYRVLGESAKSAEALEHAAALAPKDVDLLVDYGDALLAAAPPGNTLPPALVTVMRQVLALDGERREALWYVGEAEAERGDKVAAATLWGRLLGQLSPGTPEFDRVKRKIEALGVVR